MQITLIFAFLALVSSVYSSSVDSVDNPLAGKKFHEVMKEFLTAHDNGVKQPGSKQLREASANIKTTAEVNKKGWFESVIYSSTWYKNCKHPWYKDVGLIGTCALADDLGNYTTLGVTAYTDSRAYYLTQSLYSDPACTQEVYWHTKSYPILICSQDTLFHVIPAPLNPKTDNLNGFAYGIYSSVSACTDGSADGLLEASYLKLNFCYQSDTGDIMWTSCTSSGLTQVTYSSTDGTCTGTASAPVTWTSADTCSGTDLGSGWWFGGPSTFVCEN